MGQKIVIDPVTRVEGHGKVTLRLDEAGKIEKALFHVVEFRGFERFIQGRPYWEAPVMVQRLCGICPVSHHLAAAKAIDRIVGIDPENLPHTATQIRRLLHYAQTLQSHALHFFYLASPDLLFGLDAPKEMRNVVAVATEHRELARKGILLRKYGQELIQVIAGKKIHGIAAIPGGVQKSLTVKERDRFLNGVDLPSIETVIEWAKEVLQFIKQYHETNKSWMDNFAVYPSSHLGMVKEDGALELYHGRLRAIDSTGKLILPDIQDYKYLDYFAEGVERWTYLKFPYLLDRGRENGWNRVGPLARINVCDYIPTPMAEEERKVFFELSGNKPSDRTLLYHWARLIEMLHCGELIRELLHDPAILGGELTATGERRAVGIGVVEAPRGTLIHHYQVDGKGRIERCNLIVSTTHNNEPINRAVQSVANRLLDGTQKITNQLLNQIEIAVRAYDPCLSCATHALGQMPLSVELLDHTGTLIDVRTRPE
ncbi:MAG: Ni/Fe hydrogenase subunit alpha [Saprospirales bacterium]|nr:Ni/Fe hydrogenase subunit alpha [Saprospirales bacterium]